MVKRCLLIIGCILALTPGRVSQTALGERVGNDPDIGVESKEEWITAFSDTFTDGLPKSVWDINGDASVSETRLTLGENAYIQTKRTFCAKDILLLFTADPEGVFPVIELIDANSELPLAQIVLDQDSMSLVCGGQLAQIGVIEDGYAPALLLEDGTARLVIPDDNGEVLESSDHLPLTYDAFFLRVAGREEAVSLAGIDVQMRRLVYAGNVVSGIDAGMRDGLWSAPLYLPPPPYTGDPVNLYHPVGAVSGPTRYDQVGFFIRPGVAGGPDVLSVYSDGMSAWQYTAVNSIYLNRVIPMGDHNIVITFDVFRSDVTGGMVSLVFAKADGSGLMGQLDMPGENDLRVYRHMGAHNISRAWVDDTTGAAISFSGVWVRLRVEMSPETLTLSIQKASGSREGQTICSVTDSFYGGDTALSVMTFNAGSMFNIRNFKIEGMPGERSGEPLLPAFPAGAEMAADSALMYPVIEDLSKEGLIWLDPAANGIYLPERLMPDTLDLAARGEMAVRGLTNFLDGAVPDGSAEEGMTHGDFAPYGQTVFAANVPCFSSYPSGGRMAGTGRPNWGKITEATLMGRVMSGSRYRLDAQLTSLVNALKYTVADESYASKMDIVDQMSETAYAVGPLSRIMMTLQDLYELNPNADPEQRETLRVLMDELAQAHMHNAVYQWVLDPDTGEKECLYGANLTGAKSNVYNSAGNLGFMDINLIDGNALRALSRWGALGESLKRDTIREVSGLFKNLFMLSGDVTGYPIFTPDEAPKAMVSEDHAAFDGHIHAAMLGLLGLCEYGIYTGDVETLEFVRDGYEYIRGFGIAAIGLFGETCTVGEMTALAVMLSRAGVGDYWDDVDRYVRNQLAETQLTDENIGFFAETVAGMPDPDGVSPYNRQLYAEGTAVQTLERAIGTFLTDSTHPTHISSMRGVICCTGNAMQGLYYAWEGIVTEDRGVVSVNLPLNRASAWVDVDSYIPYEGKLVLHIKEARAVSVRLPNYTDLSLVQVDGGDRETVLLGRSLWLDAVQPGDVITITFPLETWREMRYCMWSNSDQWHKEGTNPGSSPGWRNHNPAYYDIQFKGNTVLQILPLNEPAQASGYKLYRGREAMVSGDTPMKTVASYVPDRTIRRELLSAPAQVRSAVSAEASSAVPADTDETLWTAAERGVTALMNRSAGSISDAEEAETAWTIVRADGAGMSAMDEAGYNKRWMMHHAHDVQSRLIVEGHLAYAADLPFDGTQTPNGVPGYGDTMRVNAAALRTMLFLAYEGDSDAMEQARLIRNYLLQEHFWQPEAVGPAIPFYDRAMFSGHMPAYALALLALLEYAEAAGDRQTADFVRAGYEYIRCFGLSAMGLYGETCTAGWMVCIAVRLSHMGMGDYWDDAQRAVVNGLLPRQEPDGLFLSNSNDPSAYLADPTASLCCTAAAVEALLTVWQCAVSQTGGAVLMNALTDKDIPELRLRGGWDRRDTAVIENKNAAVIAVRLPLYARADAADVRVNSQPVRPSVLGNRMILTDLRPGDHITLRFPAEPRTERRSLLWHAGAPMMTCTDPGSDWLPADPPRRFQLDFEGHQAVGFTER